MWCPSSLTRTRVQHTISRPQGGGRALSPEVHLKRTILESKQISRIIRRMAVEILEREGSGKDLMLVGIRTRGVPLAEALAAEILKIEEVEVPVGVLDITLYRDDLSTIAPQPVVKETHFPTTLSDRCLVLCDDVLYTGRTIRAAMDAVIDFGRPRVIRLAVLIDRGHRELPIHADIVGKTLQTQANEVVDVHFTETDGESKVLLLEKSGG